MASVGTRDLSVRVCLLTDEEQQEQSQTRRFQHFHCPDRRKGEQAERFHPRGKPQSYVIAFGMLGTTHLSPAAIPFSLMQQAS